MANSEHRAPSTPNGSARPEDQVRIAAITLAPEALGGVSEANGVVWVGFTENAETYAEELRRRFPGVRINVRTVRHSGIELARVEAAIAVVMRRPTSGIVSLGRHDEDDFIRVGVLDPASEESEKIRARFGGAVRVQRDEPLKLC